MKKLILGIISGVGIFASTIPVVAQNPPPPNIPSGIYASQGHNYYWNNSEKTSCHVVNPPQLKLFVDRGVPDQGKAPFTPYNFRGGCLWPQGLYSPPNNRGRVMYINSGKEICHVSPSLYQLLLPRFGAPYSGASLAIISQGLKDIGTCPSPG